MTFPLKSGKALFGGVTSQTMPLLLLSQHRSMSHLIARCATRPPISSAVLISRIRAGLQYEASKGLRNEPGRAQLFSEFAVESFEALQENSTTHEQKISFHKLVAGFRRYHRLKQKARLTLVKSANIAVFGPPLSFPDLSAPSTASSSQLADRIASKGAASTASSIETNSSQLSHGGTALALEGGKGQHQRGNGAVIDSPRRLEDLHSADLEAEESGVGGSADSSDCSDFAEPASPSEDEDGALEIKQMKKKDSSRRREDFLLAAKAHQKIVLELAAIQKEALGGEQRTHAWHALRDNRLTASAYGNALGFWEGGRVGLWEEKLGLREKFAGNAATAWGTAMEDEALDRYKEVTQQRVEMCSFKTLGATLVTSWLGASPDGLILPSTDLDRQLPSAYNKPPKAEGPGILEVKCPFNKGDPKKARPYKSPPWYYMPQVQGLMEVFDRNWCNVFSYTVNMAALYHVVRDEAYWRDVYEVLADFWWGNVIPAKHALARGDKEAALAFRPSEVHELTESLKERSKLMAEKTEPRLYPPKARGS